jgi:fused signal recognition particle receptor
MAWNAFKKLFPSSELSESFYLELEEKLIASDFGAKTTEETIGRLRTAIKEEKLKNREDAITALKKILKDFLTVSPFSFSKEKLNVLVMIGANGAGKTTTLAKLVAWYQIHEKKSILIGAGDTFRAAAKEQLETWAERLKVPMISQPEGSDAASVAFDTVQSALAKDCGLALIDTAGRLHTRDNLLDQLAKLIRIVDKFSEKIVRKNILVLDATLGQSVLEQARIFKDKVGLDGLILTKVDTQARGGTLLVLSRELKLPITHIAYGEKLEDFMVFDADAYLDALI